MKRDYESFSGTREALPAPNPGQSGAKEAIAVIGFALKFPQDVTSEENLWKLLMDRRATKTEVPSNRWNLDGFYKPHGNWPGMVTSRGGHFIADDPARFDAPFFSIQPAEAECMDPQQRFLLETSYHALENAGIPMEAAMGTRTSVHVGCLLQEYSQISQRDTDMPGNYQIVGSSGLSMLANRLSWFYDFTGPSMTVDTACSGSLLSVHLACQDLLSGSVDMALACGSNLSLVPDSTALLSALNMMSPDSTCYSFDERANGYSRSEGFGVILLKRLSQAINDGDTIRAVIRTTGCNQDGHTPGITQPSQAAQERLTKETYQRAGLDLSVTRYFEAHGTGTKLGDPTEAGAISSVFTSRTADDPLYIGALKSNIGHPEAASGIAGMIKTVLVLEMGIIPPNMYPERINPFIATNCPNLKFPLTATPWPTEGVRRASVNSFGYGGTNVHVVLDDVLSYIESRKMSARHRTNTLAPHRATDHSDEKDPTNELLSEAISEVLPPGFSSKELDAPQYRLLVLSAFDDRAMQRSMSSLEKWLQSHCVSGEVLKDLAYTLTEKRSSFPWRAYCVASPTSVSELSWSIPTRVKQNARLCFVFTGQGATWNGMGRELWRFDAFRQSILHADQYLKSIGSWWSVADELYNVPVKDSSIHQPELSQALCTVVQVAIVDLLSTWKVRPSAVVGHSSGEIAAAYANGAISRESAWMIAYFRGLSVVITQDLIKSSESMVAVQASASSLAPLLEEQSLAHAGYSPVIACYNSPSSLTIAGSRDALHRLTNTLREANIKFTFLDIDVAYHSRHMESVSAVYGRLLRAIETGETRDNQSKFFSTVTGMPLQDTSVLRTPEYWLRNLVSPVQFSSAVDEICATGARQSANMFVEIGPHSLLRSPVRDIISRHGGDVETDYVSVLVRNRPADLTVFECAGKLHLAGSSVDLAEVNGVCTSSERLVTTLPPYPFNDKTKYWLEGRTSAQYRFRRHVHHEFLGTRVDDWNGCEARWTNRIVLDQSPWLKDHKVNDMIIFPAAGFIVMALEAVRQVHDVERLPLGYKLRDINFPKAVTLTQEHRGTELQITLRTAQTQPSSLKSGIVWDQFTIFVYENEGWVECCSGEIAVEYEDGHQRNNGINEHEESLRTSMQSIRMAMEKTLTHIDSSDIYDAFERADLVYGPFFRAMENVHWDKDSQATGNIKLQQWKTLHEGFTDPHLIHPTALDAILQMTFPAYSIYAKNASATTVPTGFRHVWFSADLAKTSSDPSALVHAKVIKRGFRNKVFSITAELADSETPCFLAEMETATIGGGTSSSDAVNKPLYKIENKPDFDLLPSRTLFLEPNSSKDPSSIHDKELLCLASMRSALHNLSDVPDGLPTHLQEYVQWIKIQAEKRTESTTESVEYLCQRLERVDVEARLLVRVAKNLPSILAGEVDPLNLLFADDILSDFYSNFHSNHELLVCAAAQLDMLAHKKPAMRVLEIGAGTGSATEHVLRALGNRVAEYVYTDMTPSFFLKARERFPSSKLTFKTLDISQNPLPQGYKEGEFDLIIAANVLHAANGIQNSLQQCRTLLRPNGRILLLEMTNREHLLEPYIFGLLPGLSREASPESVKNNSPLLNEDEWANMLHETGFSGMDLCISDAGYITEESVSAIIISRAVAPLAPITSKIHVILDDSSEQQKEVLRYLEEIMVATKSISVIALPWREAMEQDLAQSTCVFIADLDGDLLGQLHGDDLRRLKGILFAAQALLWVTFYASTEGLSPTGGLVPGLARTLATENENCRVVSIALDATAPLSIAASNIFKITNAFLCSQGVPEDEYIELDGILCVPRVVKDRAMSARICARDQTITRPWSELDEPRLTIGTVGRMNTLHFDQAVPSYNALEPDDILIEVNATGLGSRDLLIALGQIHEEAFGSGFAGVILQTNSSPTHNLRVGDNVFGIAGGAMAKVVRSKSFQVQKIETGMDFCEAATYPVAYCTAYYALTYCAKVEAGDSVLIHRGTSEAGQATIQVAKLYGCEVFVTVEQADQGKFLHETCGIPQAHIFSSRTLDFGKGVRRLTQGRGVDIIFNSLVGEATRESWDCLAPFGRLVDVGETTSATNLPMGRSRMFVDVNIRELSQSPNFGKVFGEVVGLIKGKKIEPLTPLHVFKQSEAEGAFRLLQSEDYAGRVAIQMVSDEVVTMTLAANSKPLFDSEASYLLAGGFGGIGQSLARWMVQNGVKHLILPSRTMVDGSGSPREELVRELRAQVADVRAPLCDIADEQQVRETLQKLSDMPPIKGCIQAAMNVRDSSFANMSLEDWHTSLSPKLAGSWNLHRLLPSNLDFFVMFSSSTGIMGSFGQSNYTAGNTYQDALAAHRVQNGQRAHSIAMSMVTGVGWVAENAQVQALLKVRGMLEEVSLDDIYELLRYCCNPEHVDVSPQIITPLSLPADLRALGIVEPLGSTRPIYSYLHTLPSRYTDSDDTTSGQESKKLPSFSLQDATTLAEATDIITEAIQNQLSSLLVVSKDDIDPKKPIHKYGVDSLVAVEMRNWFAKGVGADVGTIEILGDLGIAELAGKVVRKSKFVKEELKM